ncbi:MAG TPA: DUF5655 domain-containing protein [Longimicrobiales bacterium]|nr:DUF5655 domain-containing protein [Longimicrobiales bacterium]
MAELDKATQTQLANLQKKAGRSLDELFAVLRASGLTKHGEMLSLLKTALGMGHGDANHAGPKAALRPIPDALMSAIGGFGDFEVAPKKAYVSLRRKKQFATIGPATKTRVEVGLNMKGVDGTERLLALPAGGMCQYKVNVTDPAEVDAELVAWIRRAWGASA